MCMCTACAAAPGAAPPSATGAAPAPGPPAPPAAGPPGGPAGAPPGGAATPPVDMPHPHGDGAGPPMGGRPGPSPAPHGGGGPAAGAVPRFKPGSKVLYSADGRSAPVRGTVAKADRGARPAWRQGTLTLLARCLARLSARCLVCLPSSGAPGCTRGCAPTRAHRGREHSVSAQAKHSNKEAKNKSCGSMRPAHQRDRICTRRGAQARRAWSTWWALRRRW